MQRTELQHNTHEQVEGYVRAALRLADKCRLSDADRAVLLPGILSLVAGKRIEYEQVAPILDGSGLLRGVR